MKRIVRGLRLGDADINLRLAVDGFQFPWWPGEDGDWLYVVGTATMNGQTWSFRDPCLLTHEFVDLVAWLRALADGRDAILDRRLDFVEPCLAFEFARTGPSSVNVTVELDHEAAPHGYATYDGDPVRLAFDATHEQLAQASADLAATAPKVLERQRRRGQHV